VLKFYLKKLRFCPQIKKSQDITSLGTLEATFCNLSVCLQTLFSKTLTEKNISGACCSNILRNITMASSSSSVILPKKGWIMPLTKYASYYLGGSKGTPHTNLLIMKGTSKVCLELILLKYLLFWALTYPLRWNQVSPVQNTSWVMSTCHVAHINQLQKYSSLITAFFKCLNLSYFIQL
jgi:hypothetical protein